jgi:hypothetical protein
MTGQIILRYISRKHCEKYELGLSRSELVSMADFVKRAAAFWFGYMNY